MNTTTIPCSASDMAIFAKRGDDPRLDQILSACQALQQHCARLETRVEALESRPAASAAPSDVHTLATTLLKLVEGNSSLVGRILDRASRQAISLEASAMAMKSVESRQRKRQAEKEALQPHLPLIDIAKLKTECEECAAKLEKRAPRHTSNLLKHAQEKHEEMILPDAFAQQEAQDALN